MSMKSLQAFNQWVKEREDGPLKQVEIDALRACIESLEARTLHMQHYIFQMHEQQQHHSASWMRKGLNILRFMANAKND